MGRSAEDDGRLMADYYKTLGISKGATVDEIKQCYRKLALKYHPDRNKEDPQAEAKFKEISEAYAVLSDSEKRKQYDTFGDNRFHQRYSTEDIFRGTDFSKIFSEFDLGGAESIFSQIFGGRGFGFPQQGGGRGGAGFGHFGGGVAQPGQDLEYPITIGFQEAYDGGERQVSFRTQHGQEQSFKIKIPRGIKDGGKLRLKGKGAPSQMGGAPGDLIITVTVAPHPEFKRVEQNVEVRLAVKISEALLGGSREVNTPQGAKRIKIPPGVKPGTKIRLKGLGFATPGSALTGDLFAVIDVEIPKGLNEEQMAIALSLQQVDL